MTDHPSGQPEVDVPSMLQKIANGWPVEWMSEGWRCAVCLNMVDDPQDSYPAVTIANGTAVCAAHVEQAFLLGDQVKMQRNMRREQAMARLRDKLERRCQCEGTYECVVCEQARLRGETLDDG